jgi:type II secretory pathway component PulF
MSEYILFWLSKFIAELLWAIIVIFCLLTGFIVLAIYNTFQEWREPRVKIKKENTNNQSHQSRL